MKRDVKRDAIFAEPTDQIVDFVFDEAVADVFPDMIRRSVPGYESLIAMLGVMARKYAVSDTNIYDLGCSLGAATVAMDRQIMAQNISYIAVDNSAAMSERCEKNFAQFIPDADTTVLCEDIQNIDINNASVVVINFTLQFLPPADRKMLVNKVFMGLNEGGVLILSEKLAFENDQQQALFTGWHHEFKRCNHYSEMEISQKRSALENVLIPDTLEDHQQRLTSCGFPESYLWFQNLNFASLIAIKTLTGHSA